MKRTPIPKRLPDHTPPDQAEREYYRLVKKYAEAFVEEMRAGLKTIVPELKDEAADAQPRVDSVVRMDVNIERAVRILFESVRKNLMFKFPDTLLRRWAQAMVGNVNRRARTNTQRTAAAVDLEVEPLMRDGELTPYFEDIVDENVGLIRSLSESRLPELKNKIVRAITQDQTSKTIWEMIQKDFGLRRSRARLIARDQVGKLNGRIQQYRQEQLGGKRYRWRTSKDRRVRDDHQRLEGRVCSWNNPPVVDRATGRRAHPGQDFQCRCWPEMVLEDVLD